ncbi:MAG: hypothetical protein HY731_04795, partial [Candidatus Tectomicrobia bacterium]|nr:hypothetical protein [Candidatus Tectomicrobia bacterium]
MALLLAGIFLFVYPFLAEGGMAVSPELHQEILKGLELLYNAEFEKGREQCARVISFDPSHPVGPFCKAIAYWREMRREKKNPDKLKSFELSIDETIGKARAFLKGKEHEATAYFFLGAAYGFRGLLYGSQRKWLFAYINGRRGKEFLEKTLEIDPEYYDAYLGLGMYNYTLARLPSRMKVLSFLLMIKGNEDEAIRQLRVSMEKGVYTRTEAKVFLADALVA